MSNMLRKMKRRSSSGLTVTDARLMAATEVRTRSESETKKLTDQGIPIEDIQRLRGKLAVIMARGIKNIQRTNMAEGIDKVQSAKSACPSGCCACCAEDTEIEIPFIEALAMVSILAEGGLPLKEILSHSFNGQEKGMCPFLVRGRCCIHSIKPVSCASYFPHWGTSGEKEPTCVFRERAAGRAIGDKRVVTASLFIDHIPKYLVAQKPWNVRYPDLPILFNNVTEAFTTALDFYQNTMEVEEVCALPEAEAFCAQVMEESDGHA